MVLNYFSSSYINFFLEVLLDYQAVLEKLSITLTTNCSLPVVDLQFIRSYAYARMLSPGTFNIATKNCLQFVVGAINNGSYVCVNAFGVPIQTLGTAPNDWYDMLDRLRSSSTGTDVNYSNKSTI